MQSLKRVTVLYEYETDEKIFKDEAVLLADNLAATISCGELNVDYVERTAEDGGADVYKFVEGSPLSGIACADEALLDELETISAAEFMRRLAGLGRG